MKTIFIIAIFLVSDCGFSANWNISDWAGTHVVAPTNQQQFVQQTGVVTNGASGVTLSGSFSGSFVGSQTFTNPVLEGISTVYPITNSVTTNADNSITPTLGMNLGYQPATNAPGFFTLSNPTNQYFSGIIYTNLGRKGFWRGWASGGILLHTNGGIGYQLPVTNDFIEPISTNDVFGVFGGSISNAILWQ